MCIRDSQMSQGLTSSESIVFAVVFILMFVVCGYLLIYNIFDISVMQDVRDVYKRQPPAQ